MPKGKTGMPVGAPPLYTSPSELELKAEEYFEWVKGELKQNPDSILDLAFPWKREPEPVTITGLCIFLGFESRQSFYDYCEKGEFAYVLKGLALKVENAYEKKLSNPMCTGPIFALKNMRWADNQKTELSGPGGKDLLPAIPVLNLNIIAPPKDEDQAE